MDRRGVPELASVPKPGGRGYNDRNDGWQRMRMSSPDNPFSRAGTLSALRASQLIGNSK